MNPLNEQQTQELLERFKAVETERASMKAWVLKAQQEVENARRIFEAVKEENSLVEARYTLLQKRIQEYGIAIVSGDPTK